jgi:hypothetical protein
LRTGTVHIPVVVHVVWNTDKQNISNDQINEQIRVLNEDFNARNPDLATLQPVWKNLVGNANITFFLANRDPEGKPTTGVTRTKTTVRVFSQTTNTKLDRRMKFSSQGGVDAWPSDRYLNLWVCDLGAELLGYAQFPGSPPKEDGVVIGYTCFGVGGTARAPYDLGRTTTHEVGHWLDVVHIGGYDWREGITDPLILCSGTDHCDDTPNQSVQNGGAPRFPHISCGNGPNGDLFQNFMDHTNDSVTVMFTQDQVARMDAALTGPRASLAGSDFFEFILQAGTVLPEETDHRTKFLLGYWNNDKQPDLFAIKKSGTGMQALSGASKFKTELFRNDIPFISSEDAQFDFPLADWNDDGHLDLFIIQKDHTISKKTEVTIFSGKAKFLDGILQNKATVLPETDDNYDFALTDWNGDGKPDLFVIKRSKSDTYASEIQILSGASGFQEHLLSTSTATLDSKEGTIDFAVTDWNGDGTPDLVSIKKSRTSRKRTEVRVLSRASDFKDLILKTGTALHGTERNFAFLVADWTGDGRADLVGVKKWDTESKRVECMLWLVEEGWRRGRRGMVGWRGVCRWS